MQGKVKRITRLPNSQKPDLVFNYDGLGNRVSKTVIPKSSVNNEDSITTYYVRDAQGNILATYERTKYKNGDEEFYLKEQYLYGSSRMGMKVSNQLLASNINGNVEIKEYDGYFTKTVGNKRYELTNHLGNVLAVVSDKKLPDNEPDVISVTDYYPFGMQMPGRIYTNPSSSYRFGYTGHEKENDIAEGMYGTETRLLDTRLGIWRGVDELFTMYPSWSSYSYVRNNPMNSIDPDGMADYMLNKEGKISPRQGDYAEKDSETDRLIAGTEIKTDKEGNIKNKYIEGIEKGALGNENKNENGSLYYFGQNKQDAEKTFKFVADNTKVEWSLTETGEDEKHSKFSLTTSNSDQTDLRGSEFAKRRFFLLKSHTHSHPKALDLGSDNSVSSNNDLHFKQMILQKRLESKLKKKFVNEGTPIFQIYPVCNPKGIQKY